MPVKEHLDGIQLLAYTIAMFGGLNWLTANFADFNVVTQLGVQPNLMYLGIGLLSLAALADLYGFADLSEVSS